MFLCEQLELWGQPLSRTPLPMRNW